MFREREREREDDKTWKRSEFPCEEREHSAIILYCFLVAAKRPGTILAGHVTIDEQGQDSQEARTVPIGPRLAMQSLPPCLPACSHKRLQQTSTLTVAGRESRPEHCRSGRNHVPSEPNPTPELSRAAADQVASPNPGTTLPRVRRSVRPSVPFLFSLHLTSTSDRSRKS